MNIQAKAGRLFLGLDSSTQSLSAVVIDLVEQRVVFETSLNYDQGLPHYGTRDGVLRVADPTVIHAPPLLWVEALDKVFERLREAGVPLDQIAAISGSGQQHGSVYLNRQAPTVLAALDPARPLAGQLAGLFSRPTSPIWMDSSTSRACGEVTAALGGPAAVAEATGSSAFERFTGPQIRKFHQEEPEAYASTAHIALVSSFMCSILSGCIAPIDPGDGAGMNLMDIRTRDWHPAALRATAPGLHDKLPALAASGTVVGNVSPYFVKRYGVCPHARSVIWSGDNPCSVVGLGLVQPGQVAISMGTSYTYFGTMAECHVDPCGEGHVFGSPAGGYMALNCFKNGGLARARVRDQYGLDWAGYRAAMRATPPGNHGRLMLPWFDTEIVPRVLSPGVHRKNLKEDDVAGNCRALVEAQMLAMRLHGQWMDIKPAVVYATGGASEDPGVLQIMADVFGCPAQPFAITKSAALGAALIAAQGWQADQGQPISWSSLVAPFTGHDSRLRVDPDPAAIPVYRDLIKAYATLEADTLAASQPAHI